MAAKLLHSLTDDNLDLQKQIGCMNGIFQLFDRHHILTKRGISDFNGDDTLERESSNGHLRSPSLEKRYSPRNTSNQEKQRFCSESLSRSSSFSSVDCNREPASFDRIIFPETPSKDPTMSLQNMSPQSGKQGRDLRDLVKDSMYREIQGLEPVLKHRNNPLGVVSKLQEPPWYSDEPRALLRSSSYHSKDGSSSFSVSRDNIAPRFSYDGREAVNRAPFDPMDHISKSTLKLKDLPRLSLDSKAGSMRSLHADSKSIQARPPSVVAKLMGLETLPDSVSSVDTNSVSTRSYQERDLSLIQESGFSKKLWKEPSSPRWRSPDSSMKPMARFPIEPAPWKQSSKKPVSGAKRAQIPSVYSEIEKRLKDLEFTQSGKDLRALKQILEAMQSKGFLQTEKEIPRSNFISDDQTRLSSSRSVDRQKPPTKRKPMIESPIVIMKPAKLFDGFVDNRKGLSSGRTGKNPSFKSSQPARTVRTAQTSTRPQQIGKDGNGKSSGSISPRMQQKKVELEKRSRPPTPPDSSKCRKQPNKQQGEAHSPGRRRRPKHPNVQENEISVHSNALVVTLEKSSEYMLSGLVEKNSSQALCEEESAEFGSVPLEYSSPVSVLDDMVHKDDSPSHETYTRKSIKVSLDKSRDSDENCRSSTDTYTNSKESDSMSKMNRNKLQNIEKLVEKLRRLNSTHDEARTDYIASLCENTDPDHRYVSEILLASGLLLRELGSNLTNFKFHHSGNPINPDLFLVLEQTKSSTQPQMGKIHRKLIFDTVNEILARKLASGAPFSGPRLGPLRRLNAQRLLRELCCEIELIRGKSSSKCSSNEEDDERWKNILYEDVMHHSSERWISFDDEISGAVLDIERSMFKDLVDEIVIGEFAGLKSRTAAGRRRLFNV